MVKYTLEQLKAMAYDALVGIEKMQTQLREINNAIVNYNEEINPLKDKDDIPLKGNIKDK